MRQACAALAILCAACTADHISAGSESSAGGAAGGQGGAGGSAIAYDALVRSEPSVVAYWRLSEPAQVVDEISNHHGYYVEGDSGAFPTFDSGVVPDDSALVIDGEAGEYIRIPNDAGALTFDGHEAFSVEIWFKHTGTDPNSRGALYNHVVFPPPVDPCNPPHAPGIRLYHSDLTNPQQEVVLVRGDCVSYLTLTVPLLVGRFNHVVASYDGGLLRLCVNAICDQGMTDIAAPSHTGPIRSGWDGGLNNHFTGLIDELAVYDAALSEMTIAAHYDAAELP